MEEEFQESDVVFSDVYSSSHQIPQAATVNRIQLSKVNPKHQKHKRNTGNFSPPMNIPESRIRCFDVMEYTHVHDGRDDLSGDEEVGYLGGERLPPHLIVARRISNLGREMACSFYVEDGNGRILKGRNLCQVRNSILRLTGFIET